MKSCIEKMSLASDDVKKIVKQFYHSGKGNRSVFKVTDGKLFVEVSNGDQTLFENLDRESSVRVAKWIIYNND